VSVIFDTRNLTVPLLAPQQGKWATLPARSHLRIALRLRLRLTHPDMRAVIQRVSEASVNIDGAVRGAIKAGLLIFLAVEIIDGPEDVEWLSGKILRLRVFSDSQGNLNRSVSETNNDVLLISQFTLLASTRKGNRPSFTRAARPEFAKPLCDAFARQLAQGLGRPVACGEFGADMKVRLVNDGPVTIIIDSRSRE
jgi:D-aminoacyl-tRNA deacylase